MADIFDYMKWRDDLSFNQDSLNEVDAMLLARLTYLPFELAATDMTKETLTLSELAKELLLVKDIRKKVFMREDYPMLKLLAKSERFGSVKVFGYENTIDEESQTQFSAVTYQIDGGTYFVAFRGTDSTLVGWKEDFNMTFLCPVPAQALAVQYVNRMCQDFKNNIIVGGHSKGGNLAIYGSAFCQKDIQDRIEIIYNFDGPGFMEEVLDREEYDRIRDRIKTFLPQSSIAGLLLNREEETTIIRSNEVINVMQHDTFSWKIEKNHFLYTTSLSDSSKIIDSTLKGWIGGLKPHQREEFVDAIFGILGESDAKTLKDFRHHGFSHARAVAKAIRNVDETTETMITETLKLLMHHTREGIKEEVLDAISFKK